MEFCGVRETTERAPKNFGGASLHPRRFLSSCGKKLTSSSWLSSSLPFYSPHFLNSRASIAGGARVQSSCIDSPNYLVKRKVIGDDEKVKREKFVGMTACEVAKDIRAERGAEKSSVRRSLQRSGGGFLHLSHALKATGIANLRTWLPVCKAWTKSRT
jgi:hypothetical protein